ncbi:hypothetical protein BC940DRAFT_286800 [Gongronella butleri]|nr:hypothetical protein BC940DRAFT_286800 [Gongronella butleri]
MKRTQPEEGEELAVFWPFSPAATRQHAPLCSQLCFLRLDPPELLSKRNALFFERFPQVEPTPGASLAGAENRHFHKLSNDSPFYQWIAVRSRSMPQPRILPLTGSSMPAQRTMGPILWTMSMKSRMTAIPRTRTILIGFPATRNNPFASKGTSWTSSKNTSWGSSKSPLASKRPWTDIETPAADFVHTMHTMDNPRQMNGQPCAGLVSKSWKKPQEIPMHRNAAIAAPTHAAANPRTRRGPLTRMNPLTTKRTAPLGEWLSLTHKRVGSIATLWLGFASQ